MQSPPPLDLINIVTLRVEFSDSSFFYKFYLNASGHVRVCEATTLKPD